MYEKKKTGNVLPDNKVNTKDYEDVAGGDNEIKSLVKKYAAEVFAELKKNFSGEIGARIAEERADAAKMATMSSEERAKAEIEKNRVSFESERQQYMSERAEFEAAKELACQQLPVTFAKFVADTDRDVMLENISVFKSEYLKAIETALTGRLKGTLPKFSKSGETNYDPFLQGLGV